MTNQFGSVYSKYYDLLYKDKNYKLEIEYVLKILNNNNFKDFSSLLDLGCGTGKHLNLLSPSFQKCTGIDISHGMIDRAISESKNINNIDYMVSDISNYNIEERYSCIVSLFHVFSYLVTDLQVNAFFENASKHSKKGAFLFFDYYNHDGLMNDRPSNRVKVVENEEIKVYREAKPSLDISKRILTIEFDINLTDKNSNNEEHFFNESHSMRFFKQDEIESTALKFGFELISHHKWLETEVPDIDAWYACSLFKSLN